MKKIRLFTWKRWWVLLWCSKEYKRYWRKEHKELKQLFK